jgi:hypothetical protein
MLAKEPAMPDDNNFKRRHIASLAAGAVIVLALGLAARDALIGPDAPPSAPPSEAAPLQRFSQESQLRDIAAYISGRVALVAPMVVRVDSVGASGLRWGERDTIITTSPERPVILVDPAAPDTVRPRLPAPQDSVRRDWLIVVARDPGGRIVSGYGIDGGRASGSCGPHVIEKMVLGMAITREFAGAGIFDLDGRVRGMVVSCGVELAPIPLREVTRLISDTTSVAAPADTLGATR